MKKKIIIFISIFLLLAVVLLISVFLINNNSETDEKNKDLLKKYGWNIVSGGLSSKDGKAGGFNPSDIALFKGLIDSSKKIGLDPTSYIENSATVDEYLYKLDKNGGQNPLRAMLWVYKNKIICAFIMHMEIGVRMKYWSLDTPYSNIIEDIDLLSKDE